MSSSGSSSASASSSSPSPPPPAAVLSKKLAGKNNENKASPIINHEVHRRNEGTNAHWAYTPPHGAVALDHSVDCGSYDWDAVNRDDDTEIWLVRVPKDFKLKALEHVKLAPPPKDKQSARIGSMSSKSSAYDIWTVGDDDEDGQEERTVGGEEMKNLSCLLPRRRKGKLYAAPKPIARHLVITAQLTAPDAASAGPPQVHQNPPRESYPATLLKHRFVPYGAPPENHTLHPVLAEVAAKGSDKTEKKHRSKEKEKTADKDIEGKSKKRKGDMDGTPKKLKKAKTSGTP